MFFQNLCVQFKLESNNFSLTAIGEMKNLFTYDHVQNYSDCSALNKKHSVVLQVH